MAIAPQAARNTFKKTRRVNLRVTERDYNQAHARAREEGIPYQTLLSSVSPHPHAVRLQDIDSDGHADLLVDDRSPESIRLFRGRGDGTFSGATSIDVGGDPYRGMSLADVTGDGLADLITPNPDHVAVLVAEQNGGFRPRATLPVPLRPVLSAAGNSATAGLPTGRFAPPADTRSRAARRRARRQI